MAKAVFLILVLCLVHHAAARCKVAVDCDSAVDAVPGVTLGHCPQSHGYPGGESPPSTIPSLECCTMTTYYGPHAVRYYYNGSCPVYLKFTDISLSPGETVTIKNIYCENDHGEEHEGCHEYIINHTAEPEFILPGSSSYFTFHSSGGNGSVTFKVINEECEPSCCDPCGPMWTSHNGYCYYVNYRSRNWFFHNTFCKHVMGGLIAPIYDESTWQFLYDLAGAGTWLGLHCKDDNNTVWYWQGATEATVKPNSLPQIWDEGYPLASANQHCAGFPYAPPSVNNKHLKNTNCQAHFKSVCCKEYQP